MKQEHSGERVFNDESDKAVQEAHRLEAQRLKESVEVLNLRYAESGIVIEVKYRNWAASGKMRRYLVSVSYADEPDRNISLLNVGLRFSQYEVIMGLMEEKVIYVVEEIILRGADCIEKRDWSLPKHKDH